MEAFPRRGETVLLRLEPGYRSKRSIDLTVRNPKRSRAEPWHGAPTPLRVVNEEFECELTRCELDLAKGLALPLKLEMGLKDKGVLFSEWKVQWIELEDSTGNLVREQFQGARDRWHSDPELRSIGTAFALPRSLLPGVGAWKVRAYVMRTSGFPSNEIWEVRGIPISDPRASGSQVWRTNTGGMKIELGSVKALNVPVSSLSGGAWSSKRRITADDWLIVRVGSQDELLRTQLLTLEDDRGSAWGDTRADNGPLWKGWAREWDAASTSATIRLGVSRWRVVEFLVEPTVIGAKP